MQKSRTTIVRSSSIKRRRRNRFFIKLTVAMSLIFCICFTFCGLYSYAKDTANSIPSYKYYTSIQIQEGDSLENIAACYISNEYKSLKQYIEEVQQMNHLDSDVIHAGQYLIIPYYSSVVK